jgi:hypothetical protein
VTTAATVEAAGALQAHRPMLLGGTGARFTADPAEQERLLAAFLAAAQATLTDLVAASFMIAKTSARPDRPNSSGSSDPTALSDGGRAAIVSS